MMGSISLLCVELAIDLPVKHGVRLAIPIIVWIAQFVCIEQTIDLIHLDIELDVIHTFTVYPAGN